MVDFVKNPGSESFSPAKKIGELLAKELKIDPSFYIF